MRAFLRFQPSLSLRYRLGALALLVLGVSGCASTPNYARDERDPWQGFNRQVFAFNEQADRFVAKPLAQGYRAVTPEFLEDGIGNVFNNLGEVTNLLGDALQFKFKAMSVDGGRLLINSTVGLGGFFDVASHVGLARRSEDFGQVLGYWGIDPGPYVVIPVLGPSTVRDGLSLVVDAQADPLAQISSSVLRYELALLRLVDKRAGLLKSEELVSGDSYTFLRDAYLQRRVYLINDGEVQQDSFGEEDFEDWDSF